MGLDGVKTSALGPDATKASTSATRSVEPNAKGWNKENVTVKLNATHNEGGWGVKKITYSASGAQTTAKTDASGDSATLNPYGTTSTLLAANTSYKVVVSTGAKDLAGNALAQQKVAYFKTGSI